MEYTEVERQRGGFFYRARGFVLLCPLFFLCLSCNFPAGKDELANYKDGAERRLYLLGESRPIVYNLNDGEWRAGYVAPAVYVPDRSVRFPAAAHVTRAGCVFLGWYDNEALSGRAVSGWNAGEWPERTTLWAKWIPKDDVPTFEAAAVIAALPAEGSPHTIVLKQRFFSEEELSGITDITEVWRLTEVFNGEALIDIRNALITAYSNGVTLFLDMTGCSELDILDADTFDSCDALISVALPGALTDIAGSAFRNCSNLMHISVAENNGVYTDIHGVLFTKNGDRLVRYLPGRSDAVYSIPAHVTKIGDYAFQGCNNLTSVVIPGSVTRIGRCAFQECNGLTSAEIPGSVTRLKRDAFKGCGRLTNISIAESNAVYSDIDGVLFSKTGNMLFHYPAGRPDTVYSIPGCVTDIVGAAFYGCDALSSVVIPASVRRIYHLAFYNCSALTSLVFSDPLEWYANCGVSDLSCMFSGIFRRKDSPVNLTDVFENVNIINSPYVMCWYKQ